MGESNEAMAQALIAQLRAQGVNARVAGGCAWQVDVDMSIDALRTVRVDCFWNEPGFVCAPIVKQLPSNRRAVLGEQLRTCEGPSYRASLWTHGAKVAVGETAAVHDVVLCVQGWLAGLELEQLVREIPFVDAGLRAMRAIAQQLDRTLHWEIDPEPIHALWVSAAHRRCEVKDTGDGVGCRFMIGEQQVAYHPAAGDLPAAVGCWLVEHVSLAELVARVPGVELERHAEVLEADSARWHWLHVLDRIAEPEDILAPLRELIQALSESPIATRFYSFSSMFNFCFSASSHFPWVNDGLPVVSPGEDGAILVNDTPYDLRGAVRKLEELLADYPIQPFFGSAPHHELPLLAACLARDHSALRPHLVMRGRYTQLVVEAPSGQRRCTLDGGSVAFEPSDRRTSASWPTLEQAARAVQRYCEAGEPVADIIADPATVVVMRNGKLIKRPDRPNK